MKGRIRRIVFTIIIVHVFFFLVYNLLHGFISNAKFIKDSDKQSLKNLDSRASEIDNSTSKTSDGEVVTSGHCQGIKFVSNLMNENVWLPVDEGNTLHVFSAFYIKARAKVFIIGAKHIRTIKIVCQLWYRDEGTGGMVVKEKQALIRMPREGQGKKFTSTIFECSLGTADAPLYISLSTKTCKTPLNMLRVRNASKPEKYKNKFAVCLSPLYFRYGKAYELVEWIELNRILGGEKFVVYNHSTSINVDHVLEYYTKRGLAEVVQWRLPMSVKTGPISKQPNEIHYFGQTAALNDCLFRSKHEYEYIVNVDLDEFIIPRGNGLFNWTDIIKHVGGNKNSFLFRSTYFRKEWENTLDDFPGKDLVDKFRLVTLQKFEHEGKIFSPNHRSKYIARTATVDRVLIHEVPNTKPALVPVETGLVYHYRNWFNLKDRQGQVRDETVKEKFGEKLIKHIQTIWKDLPGVELDIPWE